MTEAEELELLELERERAMKTPESVGGGTAFLRGAGQGASAGFGDELAGLTAEIRKAQPEGPEAVKAVMSQLDPRILLKALQGASTGAETYTGTRDTARAENKAAEEAHPYLYGAGNVAGGMATMAVPGLGGANTAANVAKLSALGGLYGLGGSNADLTKGEVIDTAKDTALGSLVGAGSGVVGEKVITPGLKVAGNLISKGAKKVMSSVFGPSVESIDARLANPEAIQNAANPAGLARKLPTVIKKLNENISKADKEAWAVLSEEKAIPRDILGTAIETARRDIGNAVTPADNNLLMKLETMDSNLKNLKGLMSEKNIKELIQRFDKDINWDNPDMSRYNEILEKIRTSLDGYLKTRNPEYANAMKPVADMIDTKLRFQKAFNIQDRIGQEPQFTDTTVLKARHAWKEDKAATQDLLDQVKDFSGQDILDDVKNTAVAGDFLRPSTHGSRNAVTGAAVGAAVGHVIPIPGASWAGGAVGALAGRQVDKEGGAYAAKLIDFYTAHPEAFGKFSGVLNKSLKEGPQAFAVTHFLLGQQDPEYQDQYRKIQDELDKN